jgi:hypothetical protein
MVQLVELIPDPDFLIALEPEELGLRMLPALATWPRFQELHLELLLDYLIGNSRGPTPSGQYPQNRRMEIAVAVSEAWAWLENATLLIEHPPYAPSQPSTRMLSRRAQQLAKESEPHRAFSARRIPKEALHSTIREDVWALYHRGKYDTAVFEAMKAVEVVDLHSNLRLGPIRVRSGTEIETDASLSLNLSANFVALSGESGLLFDCGLPGFDDGV